MKKALLITTDLELRSTLADWLTSDGFETMVAEDSFIGLWFAQTQQPDLILCDVNMPELNGFAILEELRLNPTEEKPFAVLIGRFSDSSRAFAAGADGFLFRSAALNDVLRSMQAYTYQIEQRSHSKNPTHQADDGV